MTQSGNDSHEVLDTSLMGLSMKELLAKQQELAQDKHYMTTEQDVRNKAQAELLALDNEEGSSA